MIWLRVLFVAYGLAALWMLTYPFSPEEQGVSKTLLGEWHIGRINTVSNVALFVPFGLLGAMAGAARRRSAAAIVIVVTLLSAAISLAAETAQVHLRERESSAIDLLANAFGGFVGAAAGVAMSGGLLRRWTAAGRWLASRSRARAATAVWAGIVLWWLAPFDLSVETYYLKQKVLDAIDAGWPRSSLGETVTWAAAVNAVLLAAGVASLGRAIRESWGRRGERGSPWIVLLAAGVALAVVGELMQTLVRSRSLDAIEPIAGIVGAVIGVVIDAVLGRVKSTGPGRRRGGR